MIDDVESLIDAIRAAFASVRYPGDAHALRDEVRGKSECEHIRNKIVGKPWSSLKVGDVAYKDNLTLYLTPEAYRYYLPGLMTLSLRNPEIYDLPAYIAEALTPKEADRRRQAAWSRNYREPFTVAQRDVIGRFLRWANERFEGGNPLEATGRALAAWEDPDSRVGR